MPILYKNIPYSQLMCHQGAYDVINRVGEKCSTNWDMIEYEKSILGMTGARYLMSEQEQEFVEQALSELDITMPFLKFQEKGQHYAYELFLTEPEYWGTRGAPLLWAYMARQFTYDKLPMEEQLFVQKYKGILDEFKIPFGKEDEYIYIERFAAGGMSSGIISSVFVKDALELLCSRIKKYG